LYVFIDDIATTIGIIAVVEPVTVINIVVIITAYKPAIVSMLIVADIFETFPAKSIVGFVMSDLINWDENFLHDLLNFLPQFYPSIDNKLNVEPKFSFAFLFFFYGYQSITYFYILLLKTFNYHLWE
jgi:hypothetical protein